MIKNAKNNYLNYKRRFIIFKRLNNQQILHKLKMLFMICKKWIRE